MNMGSEQFQDRTSIKIYKMANKNSIWLRSDSLANCNRILEHLQEDHERSGKKRKSTFSQLSRETGIAPSSVSYACWVLAFVKRPRVKLWAEKRMTRKGMRTQMRVRLL